MTVERGFFPRFCRERVRFLLIPCLSFFIIIRIIAEELPRET